MTDVKCFFLAPTDRCRIELRRYAGGSKCTGVFSYHNASVPIAVEVNPDQPKALGDDPRFPHDDPRWPPRCECGYEFAATDNWQVRYEQIYSRSDGGGECTLHDAPVGAMYDATWYPEKGPDGRSLMLVLPDSRPGIHSVWTIDLPASGGGHWTRTGEPPRITVRPSILTPGYHGFLTDGVLASC